MPAALPFPESLRARYEPEETLGAGAFGVVFRARDRELDRPVAIKVLARRLTPEVQARFAREARLLAGLEHPHVVRLYAFDAEATPPYLVTEYLDGTPASEGVEGDPVEVMREVARGLGALHAQGLVHRDVKPANLMVTREGRAVLLDLGLASAPDGATALTRTGAVLGTPVYMAPELLEGGETSPASDWYAWAATLFELCEGRPLRSGRTFDEVIASGLRNRAEFRVLEAGSPLARALRRCLATHPARRPASAREVLDLLDDAGSLEDSLMGASGLALPPLDGGKEVTRSLATPPEPPQPSRPRPRAWVPALLGLGALVGAGGLWLSTSAPLPGPPLVPHAGIPDDPSGGANAEEASGPPFPLEAESLPELQAELDAALADAWRPDGTRGAGPEPTRFPDAVFRFGVAVYDDLPLQDRVLRWIERGGRAAALGPELRGPLERYDASFEELGLPRPYGPLLGLRGEPSARPPEDALPPSLRGVVERLLASAPDLDTAAVRAALSGALRERERIEGAYRRGELDLGSGLDPTRHVAVLTGSAPEELTVLAGSLRDTTRGRQELGRLLQEGRRHTRRFLLLASALLEDPALPEPARMLERLGAGLYEVLGFLTGGLVSAGRSRLFGPAARSAAAHAFQARTLHRLSLLRSRGLLPRAARDADPTPVWEDAVTAARLDGDPSAAARYWAAHLDSLDLERKPAEYLVVYESHQARLRPHLPPEVRGRVEARVATAFVDAASRR